MFGMVLAGFVLTMAMLLTMARLDIRKFLGYSSFVDVVFAALMFEMFAGTYGGIVAGAFAGLFMTGMLYVLKYTMGYKRLTLKGWVYHAPRSDKIKQKGRWAKWLKTILQ